MFGKKLKGVYLSVSRSVFINFHQKHPATKKVLPLKLFFAMHRLRMHIAYCVRVMCKINTLCEGPNKERDTY